MAMGTGAGSDHLVQGWSFIQGIAATHASHIQAPRNVIAFQGSMPGASSGGSVHMYMHTCFVNLLIRNGLKNLRKVDDQYCQYIHRESVQIGGGGATRRNMRSTLPSHLSSCVALKGDTFRCYQPW